MSLRDTYDLSKLTPSQRGILMLLSGEMPIDLSPSTTERLAWADAVDAAVEDFRRAADDQRAAQAAVYTALRSRTAPHCRHSVAAEDAYNRCIEAQTRLSDLLGLEVACAVRRDP